MSKILLRIRNFAQKISNYVKLWKESRISKKQLIAELVSRRDETVNRARAAVNKKIAFRTYPESVEWIIVPLIYAKYEKYKEIDPKLERDSISTIYKIMKINEESENIEKEEDKD